MVSCGGAATHLIWQLSTWDETSNKDSEIKFLVSDFALAYLLQDLTADMVSQSNGHMGLVIYGGMLLEYLTKTHVLG